MARMTLRLLLDHAAEGDYGVPTINRNNKEQGSRFLRLRTARTRL
jgi:fructose/tagatose bisphosphate aldolase